jgi:hypothetical protein
MPLQIRLRVNGSAVTADVSPGTLLVTLPARASAPHGHTLRLRYRQLRRVHRPARRVRRQEL